MQGWVMLQVLPRVLTFGAIAAVLWMANELTHVFAFDLTVAPFAVAGAILGLLLLLRTNAGYEGRRDVQKLWGEIVNQTRDLAISGLTYGPRDSAWRVNFVRQVAVFPHVVRRSLCGERDLPEVMARLGNEKAPQLAFAEHMPSFINLTVAQMLHQAVAEGGLDRMDFLQIDKKRAALLDHVGDCERILKSPLPRVYNVELRRFIVLFLVVLPFALLETVGGFTPLVTMFVAYPILALDQTGCERRHRFSIKSLGHFPLDDISQSMENNLNDLLKDIEATTQQVSAEKSTS